MPKLNGKKIYSARIFYENIKAYDTDGNEYFISISDLTKILSTQVFNVEKKRIRTHLLPIAPTEKVYDDLLLAEAELQS